MPRNLTVKMVHEMISVVPKAEVNLRVDHVVGKTVGRPRVLWVHQAVLTEISKHEGSSGKDKGSDAHVDSGVRTDIDVVSVKENESNAAEGFFDALFVSAVAETPERNFD